MKLRIILMLVLGGLFVSSPLLAERYRSVDKNTHKAKKLLTNLRSHHIKFSALLSKKAKLDTWEKELKKTEKELHIKYKLAADDHHMVKAGKMTKDQFDLKWRASGKLDKIGKGIIKFKADIAKYNAFRTEYNGLAKQLQEYLYKRQPEQIIVLMKDMQKLITALDTAIKDAEFSKALTIADSSKLATEFGYKK